MMDAEIRRLSFRRVTAKIVCNDASFTLSRGREREREQLA
jgi:hypothetical protein